MPIEVKPLTSLNPYSTGIRIEVPVASCWRRTSRLNPYSTGIRIEVVFGAALGFYVGLNPYSTGIRIEGFPRHNVVEKNRRLNPYSTGIRIEGLKARRLPPSAAS